jgi:hypothetical protein
MRSKKKGEMKEWRKGVGERGREERKRGRVKEKGKRKQRRRGKEKEKGRRKDKGKKGGGVENRRIGREIETGQ